MIKDDVDVLTFGNYYESLKVRLWHPVGNEKVYVETLKKAFIGENGIDMMCEFWDDVTMVWRKAGLIK
jgi:hypothetical protein